MERDDLSRLVASNIKAIMDAKGLTAPEVARRVGSNPTVVYDILSGKSKSPTLHTVNKIALKGLGVPITALLQERGDDQVDREIAQVFATIPASHRRQVLAMIRAYVSELAS